MARTVLADRIRDDEGKPIPGFETLQGPVYLVIIELTPWHEKDKERERKYIAISMGGQILLTATHKRPPARDVSHASFTS